MSTPVQTQAIHTAERWIVFGADEPDRFPGIDVVSPTRETVVVWGDPHEECGVRGDTREIALARARLIAASPTMADYIRKCAAAGDAEAASIMEAISAPR